jgi:hypothetical protein
LTMIAPVVPAMGLYTFRVRSGSCRRIPSIWIGMGMGLGVSDNQVKTSIFLTIGGFFRIPIDLSLIYCYSDKNTYSITHNYL